MPFFQNWRQSPRPLRSNEMPTSNPPKKPDRYRLYVDESGDHTFAKAGSSNQYLALLGVWFRQDPEYNAFAESLVKFKREILGPSPDDPIHLHRKDILQRRGRFGVLNDPTLRTRFDHGLIDLIRSAAFRAVCIVIDKAAHQRRFVDPIHPYHNCLAALLDRYCGWLSYKNAIGDVLAESRGRTEDWQLQVAYAGIHDGGTSRFGPGFHARTLTSKDLKLKRKSDNIAGLELADLLAHPAKTEVLIEHKLTEPVQQGFVQELHKLIREKLHRDDATGGIPGHGTLLL